MEGRVAATDYSDGAFMEPVGAGNSVCLPPGRLSEKGDGFSQRARFLSEVFAVVNRDDGEPRFQVLHKLGIAATLTDRGVLAVRRGVGGSEARPGSAARRFPEAPDARGAISMVPSPVSRARKYQIVLALATDDC
jgi:hypothetical protein